MEDAPVVTDSMDNEKEVRRLSVSVLSVQVRRLVMGINFFRS